MCVSCVFVLFVCVCVCVRVSESVYVSQLCVSKCTYA